MPRLFTFGCSVTQFPGKKEHLASLLNLELVNLSHPAGSNQLQVKRLIELIVNNELKNDDIIYWQITADTRNFMRLKGSSKEQLVKIQETQMRQGLHHYITSKFNNLFDNEERYDLLMISPIIERQDFDVQDELQTLLGTLILLKSYCPKLLVSFGWKRVIQINHMPIFKKALATHKIDFIEEYFVEFSRENNLEMLDNMHPGPEAGQRFAEDIIFKKIKELNWI